MLKAAGNGGSSRIEVSREVFWTKRDRHKLSASRAKTGAQRRRGLDPGVEQLCVGNR